MLPLTRKWELSVAHFSYEATARTGIPPEEMPPEHPLLQLERELTQTYIL
jgi:hypothetical protein